MFLCSTFSINTFLWPIKRYAARAVLAVFASLVMINPALAATILSYIGAAPQTFIVPTTGTYSIFAWGASGGTSVWSGETGSGLGAEIGGQFMLTAEDVLTIFVGGVGNNGAFDGGGGGGTFVVTASGDPLVVAGGGGGVGFDVLSGHSANGQGGMTGASNSLGGSAGNVAGGGGGFSSNGGSPGPFGSLFATGGSAYPDLTGGRATIAGTSGGNGGYGGGGGSGSGAGGGGGGYSGGDAGYSGSSRPNAGGGGGSFDSGTSQVLIAGEHLGNGLVEIDTVITTVPEPSSLSLLGVVFTAVAAWQCLIVKMSRSKVSS